MPPRRVRPGSGNGDRSDLRAEAYGFTHRIRIDGSQGFLDQQSEFREFGQYARIERISRTDRVDDVDAVNRNRDLGAVFQEGGGAPPLRVRITTDGPAWRTKSSFSNSDCGPG